jgi:hypothetical protein
MSCPRCTDDHIDTLAISKIPDAWEILQCQRCLFTWRTTEQANITTREAYPDVFRLTQEDMDAAPIVPSVPPLLGR